MKIIERIRALAFPKPPEPPEPPKPLDPLVLFLGGPAHGRTTRTQKLRVFLDEPDLNAQYIYDRYDAEFSDLPPKADYVFRLIMVVPIDRKSYVKVSMPGTENMPTP